MCIWIFASEAHLGKYEAWTLLLNGRAAELLVAWSAIIVLARLVVAVQGALTTALGVGPGSERIRESYNNQDVVYVGYPSNNLFHQKTRSNDLFEVQNKKQFVNTAVFAVV